MVSGEHICTWPWPSKPRISWLMLEVRPDWISCRCLFPGKYIKYFKNKNLWNIYYLRLYEIMVILWHLLFFLTSINQASQNCSWDSTCHKYIRLRFLYQHCKKHILKLSTEIFKKKKTRLFLRLSRSGTISSCLYKSV